MGNPAEWHQAGVQVVRFSKFLLFLLLPSSCLTPSSRSPHLLLSTDSLRKKSSWGTINLGSNKTRGRKRRRRVEQTLPKPPLSCIHPSRPETNFPRNSAMY
ncbi:hypothetical protein BJY00DRAFT_126415 [Aspergillus carlsbadensis]|nr:hypothetical protein BJY00DRAFT_126415 [Aspergillus carlsbadensis]